MITLAASAASPALGDTVAETRIQNVLSQVLAGSVSIECPNLRLKYIEVDRYDGLVDILKAEMQEEEWEPRINYREGVRRLPRLQTLPQPSSGVAIDPDGHYLLVGGFGGVGREIVNWLRLKGVRTVSLVSRSAHYPLAHADWLDTLTRDGIGVSCHVGDVTDIASFSGAIEAARAAAGNISGVFFLPTYSDDGTFVQTSWERFTRSLRPKLVGVANLCELLKGQAPDFVMCASSISALATPPGLSAYAAANALMEAIAHRYRERGLKLHVVQFGPWEGTGMMEHLPDKQQQRMIDYGLLPATANAMCEGMEHAIVCATSSVLVARLDWDKIAESRARLGFPRLQIVDQSGISVASPSPQFSAEIAERIRQAPAAERFFMLREYLRAQVSKVLRVKDEAALFGDVGFFELGMDSIMALELKRTIEFELGVTVPVTVVFNYSSVDAMADYLHMAHFALPKEVPEALSLDDMETEKLAALLAAQIQ